MPHSILVCEDEYFVRWVLTEHLRTQGYHVLEAQNGEECINIVNKEEPDIILMDLCMPRMDGISAIKALRQRGNKTPIFVLSGHAQTDVANNLLNLGADKLIPKPYHLAVISKLLKNELEGTKMPEEEPTDS